MPSPSRSAFMDRMRLMMFRPIGNQAPEPARPDYNELSSADEAVQIPVGLDGNPIFRPNSSLRTSETQTIDWQRIAEQVQRGEHRLGRSGSDQADLMRYQTPESVAQRERYLSRTTLEQARDRLMAGNTWHHPNDHRGASVAWSMCDEPDPTADGLYELGYGGAVKEVEIYFKGTHATVLPIISLQTNQIEYRKGSPEPRNGPDRVRFEQFAMEKIHEWGYKHTQAFK